VNLSSFHLSLLSCVVIIVFLCLCQPTLLASCFRLSRSFIRPSVPSGQLLLSHERFDKTDREYSLASNWLDSGGDSRPKYVVVKASTSTLRHRSPSPRHDLYGSTSCCKTNTVVKVMGKSKIRPFGAPQPMNEFRWNLECNYAMGMMTTYTNSRGAMTTWVVWMNTWRFTCWFLSIPCKIFCFIIWLALSLNQWTDFDDLYATQGKCLLEVKWIGYSGVMHKIRKLAYYWSYCTNFNQILHTDKDRQIILHTLTRRTETLIGLINSVKTFSNLKNPR